MDIKTEERRVCVRVCVCVKTEGHACLDIPCGMLFLVSGVCVCVSTSAGGGHWERAGA